MDQYTTTYQNDYVWPNVPRTRPASQEDNLRACEYKVPLGEQAHECWCRRDQKKKEQMAAPEIPSSRVGAAPESILSRLNQPNGYLDKLRERYPYLYDTLMSSPPEDLLRRVYRDRMLSTYQVDYCKEGQLTPESFGALTQAGEELKTMGRADSTAPSGKPGEEKGWGSLEGTKKETTTKETGKKEKEKRPAKVEAPKEFVPIGKSPKKQKTKSKSGGAEEEEEDLSECQGNPTYCANKKRIAFANFDMPGLTEESIAFGRTEYQETFSKIGFLIMKDRIHYPSNDQKKRKEY